MQRKTVTVVFCDVTGSTELGESTDPEALRALLARYFERMRGIVEAHGGSVEKFIGDAVMAVFGVPAAHEDDALRACRAAIEMRDAFPELGIAGRIGVNTGEVVTGTEERLATGDAVNVAARLEQAAQSGEVLVGETTLALVRAAVEVGEERQLELKGKAAAVPTWPLLAVTGEVERRFATPMVGRETELRRLHDAFERSATARASCSQS
jgi:class 3 adenylate cyclase